MTTSRMARRRTTHTMELVLFHCKRKLLLVRRRQRRRRRRQQPHRFLVLLLLLTFLPTIAAATIPIASASAATRGRFGRRRTPAAAAADLPCRGGRGATSTTMAAHYSYTVWRNRSSRNRNSSNNSSSSATYNAMAAAAAGSFFSSSLGLFQTIPAFTSFRKHRKGNIQQQQCTTEVTNSSNHKKVGASHDPNAAALDTVVDKVDTNDYSCDDYARNDVLQLDRVQEVAVKAKRKKTLEKEETVGDGEPKPRQPKNRGSLPPLQLPYNFFLGITPQTMKLDTTEKDSEQNGRRHRPMDVRQGMSEALDELRSMRLEMEQLRKELSELKQFQMGPDEEDDGVDDAIEPKGTNHNQRLRNRHYEQVSVEVEKWAEEMLFPQDVDEDKVEGWTAIPCHKLLRSKFNQDGQTRVYLTWMKDSRPRSSNAAQQQKSSSFKTKNSGRAGTVSREADEQEWPCVRLYSTIDAPCHEVSVYLSNESHVRDYNLLIDEHKDLEEISSHSKICWARSPAVLFIKPRNFVTFCAHRWRRDGTQVVINQACDSYQPVTSSPSQRRKVEEAIPVEANAFAFQGATFIGPDPQDPEGRTRIAMLSHASPGRDVPSWACKAAIQSLLPMEPYRLFFNINQGVQTSREELQVACRRLLQHESATDMATATPTSNASATPTTPILKQKRRTSCYPAGIAQLGYACFWPDGGGIKELEETNGNDDEPSVAETAPSVILSDATHVESASGDS